VIRSEQNAPFRTHFVGRIEPAQPKCVDLGPDQRDPRGKRGQGFDMPRLAAQFDRQFVGNIKRLGQFPKP